MIPINDENIENTENVSNAQPPKRVYPESQSKRYLI